MRRIVNAGLGILLVFVSLQASADSEPKIDPKTDPVPEAVDLKVTNFSRHHVGLGLSGFIFLDDLRDQFGNAIGPTLSYEFDHPVRHDLELGVGLRVAYFNAKKNGYDNTNVLATPVVKLKHTGCPQPIGAILGFDVNYWTQSKTFIQRQPLHEDVLYGLLLGVYSETNLEKWGHLEYLLGYHMQQFSFTASYFEIGLQYMWDF